MATETSLASRLLHLVLVLFLTLVSGVRAADPGADERITVSMRQAEIAGVMEMISRTYRINILLARGVEGPVSFNLYDVSVPEAIETIAEVGGFVVERRPNAYVVMPREDAGKFSSGSYLDVRTFRLHYVTTDNAEELLRPYLSDFGEVTSMEDQGLIMVKDRPEFLERIADLIAQIDAEPQQILIEAQILEVVLDDSETYGLDWRRIFDSQGGGGEFGMRGQASSTGTGFFFDYSNDNVALFLNMLESQDRVRTLSTPKLLTMEGEEASVVVGDRIGYRVTTTINQVTTESVEFLESGVILRVTPQIDRTGRILLDVHPEVSTGVLFNGLPSQTTTEVTTRLLVESGQTVFIGGLMKSSSDQGTAGLPGASQLPVLGRLFGNRSRSDTYTETVVLITPTLVDMRTAGFTEGPHLRIGQLAETLRDLPPRSQ